MDRRATEYEDSGAHRGRSGRSLRNVHSLGSLRSSRQNSELAEGSSGGGKEGVNGFKKTGYGGPCPQPGGAHRYFPMFTRSISSRSVARDYPNRTLPPR